MDDITRQLITALKAAQALNNKALGEFNWGASSLSAEAIQLLNEVPGIIDKALAAVDAASDKLEDPSRQVLINLIAGLSLADHMGDASEDAMRALKQIGIEVPWDYEGSPHGDEGMYNVAHYLATHHDATTLWGTTLLDDDDEDPGLTDPHEM